MRLKFVLRRYLGVGVGVSFFKFFGIEEFEFSAVHTKKVIENGAEYGQNYDGECPTNGARWPSSVVDYGPNGPNGNN